jgi:hypothetical protein
MSHGGALIANIGLWMWQVFTDNPVTEFVELPEELRELRYCGLLCGVIRGALEQVRW